MSVELLGVGQGRGHQGDTSKNLPWTCRRRRLTITMTRGPRGGDGRYKKKLQEIAAKTGGRSGSRGGRCVGGVAGMTLARRPSAIDLGGYYDGHELPKDINKSTKTPPRLAGQGLMGVGKDNFTHDGQSRSFVAGFAEVRSTSRPESTSRLSGGC